MSVLDATLAQIEQAIAAGENAEACHDLCVSATLVASVAEAGEESHPVLARADEHLRDAAATGGSELRFHARQARSLVWAANGGGLGGE